MPFKEFCHNKLHTDWLNKSKENYSGNPNSLIRRPLATVKRHFAEISNVDVSTLKKAKFCEFCVNELSSYCTRGNEHDYCDSERPSSRRGNENEYSKEPMERAHNKVDQTDNLNLFKEQLFESDLLQQLNEADRSRLAYKLGSFEAKAVQLNGIENLYKDMSFMQQFKLDEYLTKFNPVLFAIIDGFTSKSSVKNKDYLVAKTLEMIYCVIFVNIVLPVCFLQNLLLYVASGSRNAVNLTGKGGPHGSYPTVREWISNQTSKPLQFPDGDCVVIFDNNQVIGRSWNIKVNHKTKSSVVTTICQLQYDGYHNIQRQPQLKPYLWLRNIDFIRDNVRIIPQNLLDVHYRMLYFTVAERLKKIISEQRQGTDCNISDDIDDTVAMQKESEEVKVCAKCGHNNPKTKRVCLNCKTNLKQAQLSATQADVYGTFTYAENKGTASNYHNEVRLDIARTDENVYRIQSFQEKAPELIHGLRSEHRSQPPTLSISDPAFMNPNSIESVKLILRQIGLNAGIRQYGKGNREWLFVVCDGLPFGLCNKVIERTLRCGLCKCSDVSYTSETEFQAHHNSIHTGKDEIKVKEFDWVILRPGN